MFTFSDVTLLLTLVHLERAVTFHFTPATQDIPQILLVLIILFLSDSLRQWLRLSNMKIATYASFFLNGVFTDAGGTTFTALERLKPQ